MTRSGSAGLRGLLGSSGLPRHEAERLLMAATGLDRAGLAAERIDEGDVAAFARLAARRRAGEPLQYLEGTVQFGPVELIADRRALIPRPETEQLWELAVGSISDPPGVVVDLCTGSGNLALALKHRFPAASVFATDASEEALGLAAENQAHTGLEVEWCLGDLFAALPESVMGRVDLLVANPPYLSEGEVAELPVDVREHEPRRALVSGSSGDEVLARIAARAERWLRPGGVIACEISEFRAEGAVRLFRRYGGRVLPDLTGKPRFVLGRRAGT